MTAIYFHPQDRRLPPVVYGPFKDAGHVVTPLLLGQSLAACSRPNHGRRN